MLRFLRLPHVLAAPALLLAAACSTTVQIAESAGGTTGAGASGASGAAGAAPTGTGGSACVGYADVDVDDGGSLHLVNGCESAPDDEPDAGPIGMIVTGGANEGLAIVACASPNGGGKDLTLHAEGAEGPGTYTSGGLFWTFANGSAEGLDQIGTFQIVITSFGAVGEPIDGTFAGAADAFSLSGSFHVCRAHDVGLPP